MEKLRPGEAVESLVRLAVDSGSITDLHSNLAKRGRYWKETGEGIEEPESERFVKELVELGKRSISEELVKEFETILAEADKLYDQIEKSTIENGVSRTKRFAALR